MLSKTTSVCPKCGSGKVAIEMVDSDDAGAECMSCGWKGVRSGTMIVPLPANPLSFSVDEDRALEIARQIAIDFMRMLYQHASQPIGLCLIESGMVGQRDTVNLTRILRATCLGAHKAALDEAEVIAAEHKAEALLS